MSETEDLLYQELAALEERVEELEAELADLRALRERVDELDERTDMMQLVDTSDDLDGRGRSIRLLQHMQRKASRQGLATISLTRDQADEALHYPDVDRTTIYSDMRRCVRLVGDPDLCWYQGSEEGAIDESQLHLDYSAFKQAAASGAVEAALVEESTAQQGGA